MATAHLSVGIAFLAGLVSFISPCVLPLVPAYLSFLTGSSVEDLRERSDAAGRAQTMLHAVAFIAGFTAVFVALGVSASTVGAAMRDNQALIAKIGGVIVIIFGLQMLGVFRLKFLAMDTRLQYRSERRSLFASLIVGLAFAAGWSPCIGPILAAILALASQQQGALAGAWLLFIYSMGLALPFLVTAAALGAVLPAMNRMKRVLPAIEFAAGLLMIFTGYVLVTNSFVHIAGRLYSIVPTPKL